MTAINYFPKERHSLTKFCELNAVKHNTGLRIVDDYIKHIDTTKFAKHESGNKIVFSCNKTGMQYYIELLTGMIIDNVPTVAGVLFSSNVLEDLNKIINKKL